MNSKNPHAVALGRKGGRVRSEAKKASGKLNMEKARKAKADMKCTCACPIGTEHSAYCPAFRCTPKSLSN